MPEQIYIGNFAKGLTTSRLPFVIDNDAFPTMYNFYSWRGRAKRKRGTIFLGQLEFQEEISASPLPWQLASFSLVAGAGNLISHYSLGSTSSIVPGSIDLVVSADQTYTDPLENGTLHGSTSGAGAGTINYATGAFTTVSGATGTVTGTFSFFPGLPVMGLRDFAYTSSPGLANISTIYPFLLAFDTEKSYQINQSGTPVFFYNVSFYKETNIPVTWSGADYQQFWTVNYQSALWATNNKPGLNFVNGTYTSGSGSTMITFNFKSLAANFTTLIIGDELWFNEWTSGGSTINGITGIVSDVTGAAAGNYVVTFVGNQTVAGTGIAQLLTNSITGQDGIKWYDGDPTSGTGLPTTKLVGWVNFAPPLTAATVSIDDETAALYYLVGALAIVPFKDRLLFFSPWIQTSTGNPIQLTDTVIWSWNGTPYYASPTPVNEVFNVKAYYQDQTGLGGNLPAGTSQPIITISNNEDVLLVGFGGTGRKTRFAYTGNDLNPFLFFNINSELPSDSTFSSVTLDKGALDIGAYGIAMTDQQSSQRIDLDIPDYVFQIQAQNNGVQRVNAVRDFFKEWVYFSYPVNSSLWKFPTQTFLFNYRDGTWAIQYENFTTHGTYRAQEKKTWSTTGFSSWNTWREAWNSGSGSPLFPSIVAGNPQGYVLIKGQGTGEAQSGTIDAIASSSGNTQITSINHCVAVGDYLYFTGVIGFATASITAIALGDPTTITLSYPGGSNTFTAGSLVEITGIVGTTELNGNVYTVQSATSTTITLAIDSSGFTPYVSGGTVTAFFNTLIGRVISTADADTFVVDIPVPIFTTVYLGLGKYTRLSQPLIQTKQFPVYWDEGRQTRLSVQKYLMDYTANAQVTVNIYLSQDPDDAWNSPPVNPPPNSLIYSQVLYTCPESTNIGLTPSNTNLQMPTAEGQYQIWHRFNTSLIGDSVQVGITLSDEQMRNLTYATSEITLHGMHLTVDKGPHLS
jgi:hypothetical protein